MSWYTDPQLFINCYGQDGKYYIDRIVQKYDGQPVFNGGFKDTQSLNFSKHLSLGNNKESDYDALKSLLAEIVDGVYRFINCQGLVIHYDNMKASGTWSRVEEHDSIFYGLPGIQNPFDTMLNLWAEKQRNSISREKMIRKMIQLVEENSLLKKKLNDGVTNLQEQLNQEKNDKKALQTQVFNLTAKLEECCGAGSGFGANVEPWPSGDTILNHWVPFEEPDVPNFPKNLYSSDDH